MSLTDLLIAIFYFVIVSNVIFLFSIKYFKNTWKESKVLTFLFSYGAGPLFVGLLYFYLLYFYPGKENIFYLSYLFGLLLVLLLISLGSFSKLINYYSYLSKKIIKIIVQDKKNMVLDNIYHFCFWFYWRSSFVLSRLW